MGERYKMVTKESGVWSTATTARLCPIKPEFTKKHPGDEQPITPAALLRHACPEMDKLKRRSCQVGNAEEDVLTWSQMFPQVAPKFFDKRNAKKRRGR